MAVNIPNDHKVYQHFLISGPPKFTQIRIFGLKRSHLATLDGRQIVNFQTADVKM
jgi:hypothetical protein